MLVHNGHAGDVLLDKHVDDVHDGRIHGCSRQIRICANIRHLCKRLPQLLRLLDVHGDELQYAVLGYDADDHSAAGLIVAVYNGDTPRARLEHQATCLVDGAVGVDGDRLNGLDAECLLDFWKMLAMIFVMIGSY
jgi:hypothetical protein